MKNYILKCDKWYSSTQSIFSEGRKVGTFFPGLYSSTYRIFLEENEFVVKRKNVFSNNLLIYSHSKLLAEVKNFAFKNQSIITTTSNERYVLKSNVWNSRHYLTGREGMLGECNQKTFSTYLSFDDKVEDFLVAITIAQTQSSYEAAILVACFVPIITVIIT